MNAHERKSSDPTAVNICVYSRSFAAHFSACDEEPKHRDAERWPEPVGLSAGLRDARETCGRAFGGVRRPAPINGSAPNERQAG